MRERFENDDFSPFSGPGYHEGKGPKIYHRSDERIYEEVCQAILNDPTLDATDIHVKVEEGIVILEGKARDRMDKRVAEAIAEEIPGVLDVRNEIRLP